MEVGSTALAEIANPAATEPQTPQLGKIEIKTSPLVEKVNPLIEKLSPEVFKDEDGNDRTAYNFKNPAGKSIKVVFYSPGEMPYSAQVTQDRRSFVIGEQPKLRGKNEWDGFLAKVQQDSKTNYPPTDLNSPIALAERAEAVNGDRATFFVESGPRQLFDAAFVLGAEDPTLRESRKLAAIKRLDSTANTLIDRVVADKAQYPDKSHDAEALAILVMQGNQEARELLDLTLKVQEEKDQARKAEADKTRKEWVEGKSGEPLNLKDLVAVHITKFSPRKGINGLEMASTFDGTDWQVPRDTVHFALNHPVAGHAFGNWDAAPIAVITPLDKMIEANGNPLVLNTVDTFFEVSPGTRIKLPEGSVIVRPDKLPDGQLFKKEQGAVVYKEGNITPADIQVLILMLGPNERDYFNDHLRGVVADVGIYNFLKPSSERTEIEARRPKLESIIGSWDKPQDMLQACTEQGYGDVIKGIITAAGLTEEVPQETIDSIISKWGSGFISKIKNLAIKDQIKKMGYQVQPGGAWSWGNDTGVTIQTVKLGAELGIDVLAHTDHWSKRMEEGMIGGMGRGMGLMPLLESGEITPSEYRDRTHKFVKDNFDKMNPATRRMFYLMGAI